MVTTSDAHTGETLLYPRAGTNVAIEVPASDREGTNGSPWAAAQPRWTIASIDQCSAIATSAPITVETALRTRDIREGASPGAS